MKTYTFEGKTYTSLPDPLRTAGGEISPMTEQRFKDMGGVIGDDGQPTPAERVHAELNAALDELAKQVPDVTIEDFKEAAQTLYSAGLIAWAKSKGVPDIVIDAARSRIVEIMADAMRIGMTWDELIGGIIVYES